VRAVVALGLLAGCFTKPDRPAGEPDAPEVPGARVVSFNKASNTTTQGVDYQVQIPPGAHRFLIVTAQRGTNCDDTSPNVIGITVDGHPLSLLTSIVGTPCGGNTTSEAWTLVAPPVGDQLSVSVQLDGFASSLHSAAIVLDGVDQDNPVRNMATMSGAVTTMSSISLFATPGDLIVDVIGHGHGIVAPGPAQTKTFIANHSQNTTLDNSGASTLTASEQNSLEWTFDAVDEWQAIAIALAPSI